MMNSTLLGGENARNALARASLKLEVDTDWCIGTCEHWSKTEKGKVRYTEIKRINDDRKERELSHI